MKLRVVSSWTICVSLVVALALVQGQAQGQVVQATTPTVAQTETIITTTTADITTTTTSTTTTTTTTTTTPTATTPSATITVTTVPTLSSTIVTSTPIVTLPTSSSNSATVPPTNFPVITTTTTASVQPPIPSNTTKDDPNSNVAVIAGSVGGVAALAIVVATTLICLRRRRRNNRDLTFDTLQGMSSPASGRPRASQRFTANSIPAGGIGRDSSSGANGYDDGYEYEVAQSNAYGQHNGYGNEMYDSYGTPQQAYQNPSIFQEDNINYSTASSMGRNRTGFDQNLPEIMYRNGDLSHPSGGVTGYYDDDVYNQSGWNQGQAGGYIGPKGLWVANPTSEHQQQQYYQEYKESPTTQQQQEYEMTSQAQTLAGQEYEKNAVEPYDASETVVGSSSPHSKFLGHNPQTLPESPRLQQLRSGDLFGQDSTENKSSSPRSANATVNAEDRANIPSLTSSSPRLASARDMRSFELARHSPGRSSGEGVHSYAHDLPRPSVSDRPSMDSNVSGLNPNKSLRTLRRENWS
ncbi:hypothetical protein BGZ59_008166 [Podila verticillata]|nr:hypothetical protein BGZ59_008166 [Podila verticillata]KFH64824.1 hypothetical protein MVEG_09554 [Podila verticillata NRRL 6337]